MALVGCYKHSSLAVGRKSGASLLRRHASIQSAELIDHVLTMAVYIELCTGFVSVLAHTSFACTPFGVFFL
jgi:hypothetical protein